MGESRKQRRLLLLTGREMSTEQIEAILNEAGYEVWCAREAEEALHMVEKTDPDVVFLTATFSWAGDEEFCRALRTAGGRVRRPLVLLDTEDEPAAPCVPAEERVPMPVNQRELLAVTRAMLRLSELHTELGRKEEGLKDAGKRISRLLDEVRFRDAQLEVKKMLMELDLEMAHEIQKKLLSPELPSAVGVEFGAYSCASRRVGGDLYCFHRFDDGSLGICIADVAGHGLVAALVGAMARTCFNCYAPQERSPADLLQSMDAQLSDVLAMGVYVTMFYGIYRPGDGHLVFSTAGHPRPILIRQAGGPDRLLEAKGHVIGAFEEGPFETGEVALATGDVVVFYTDGIDEAANPDGEHYGSSRLQSSARQHHDLPAAELASLLGRKVSEWAAGEPIRDDVTIVVLKRTH